MPQLRQTLKDNLSICGILLLGAAFTALYLYSDWPLSLQGQAIWQEGQYWRIVTGQFSHGSWRHWLVDLGGVFFAWWVGPKYLKDYRGLVSLAVLIILTGVLIAVYQAPGAEYVGISGMLYGWMLLNIVMSPYYGRFLRLLIAFILLGKVTLEQTHFYDPDLVQLWVGGQVATYAHLLGMVAAGPLLIGIAIYRYNATRSEN